MEKERKKKLEALDLQDFYVSQTKEVTARKQVEAEEELEYASKDKTLLKVKSVMVCSYCSNLNFPYEW